MASFMMSCGCDSWSTDNANVAVEFADGRMVVTVPAVVSVVGIAGATSS